MNESFLLGLSSGVSCLASCGIVLFPYIMGRQASSRYITVSMGTYLGGRLMVYLLLGLLAAFMGKAFFLFDVFWKSVVTGSAYLVFSFIMAFNLIQLRKQHACSSGTTPYHLRKKYKAEYVPFIWGIVSSLNLCPPLLIAFTQTATAQLTPMQSMLSFFLFFAGTAVYFLPLPFLGFFKKNEVLKTIGILSTALVTTWFFIKGLIILTQLLIL